jgi:hypothetical protein
VIKDEYGENGSQYAKDEESGLDNKSSKWDVGLCDKSC